MVLLPIDEAAERFPELIGQTLDVAVPAGRTKFTALHAAFRTGGTFVHVPAGVDVALPIQTFTYLERDGLAVFPHTIVSVGEGASVTVIDRFASPALGRALSDAVVEIHAGPGSNVRYVSLQEYGAGVTHLSVQRAILGADAQVRSLAVAFGASLSRTEVESVLAGAGAYSEMLGLYFAEGDQHFDFRSLQDHEAPNGTSDLLYKGVLTDRARAIYSGWRAHPSRGPPVRRLPDQPERGALGARQGRLDPEPGDREQRRPVRPRGERRSGRRRHAVLPPDPGDPRGRGDPSRGHRLLP